MKNPRSRICAGVLDKKPHSSIIVLWVLSPAIKVLASASFKGCKAWWGCSAFICYTVTHEPPSRL